MSEDLGAYADYVFLSVGQKLICGHSDGLRIDLLRNNDQNVQDKCIGAWSQFFFF